MSVLPPVRTPWRQRLSDLGRGPLTLGVWIGAALLCTWLLGRRAERLQAVGVAQAREYEISSPLAGRIDEVLIGLLEEVEPGQEIAVLDAAGVEARIDTLRAVVSQLRSELEAARVQLGADERTLRDERLAEARRFAGDEEGLQLDALAIAVDLEADRVERQRLLLRLKRVQELTVQGVTAEGELDDARLLHERVDVRIRQNELRLSQTRADLALAQRRRAEYAELEPLVTPQAAQLDALRERIRVEELRLCEIEVEREALVLRAPVHSIVQRLLAAPGQALTPGEPLAVLVALDSPEVLTYLSEASALVVRAGARALVSQLRPPWKVAECTVVRSGRAVELLPQRLWANATRPEYGLPVLTRGAAALELLPGEKVAVRFLD